MLKNASIPFLPVSHFSIFEEKEIHNVSSKICDMNRCFENKNVFYSELKRYLQFCVERDSNKNWEQHVEGNECNC